MLVETRFDAVIIGGGANGTCIARDLSLRGLSVLLLEQGDLAEAYTGVSREILGGASVGLENGELGQICVRERDILCKIAPNLIDSCNSYVVAVSNDDIKNIERVRKFYAAAQIPFDPVNVDEFLKQEPNCNPAIQQVFQTHETLINPALWIIYNAQDAKAHGATIQTYCEASHLLIEDKTVIGVQYLNKLTNQKINAYGKFIINATGPWVSKLEKDLELTEKNFLPPNIEVTTRIIFQDQLSSNIIWALKEDQLDSILIPAPCSMILGEKTQAISFDDIADFNPDYDDLEDLYTKGEKLIPTLRNYQAIRSISIFQARNSSSSEDQGPMAPFTLFDYTHHGYSGFLSVFGGNLTISRYIAEKVADEITQTMNVSKECETASTLLWASDLDIEATLPGQQTYSPKLSELSITSHSFACSPTTIHTICPCYNIEKSQLKSVRDTLNVQKLEDYSRRTSLGWGECLGATCLIRLCELESQWGEKSHSQLLTELSSMLETRWKTVLLGNPQLKRQIKLMKYMFRMGGALQ